VADTRSTSAFQPLAWRMSRVAAAARIQKPVSPSGVLISSLTAIQMSNNGPEEIAEPGHMVEFGHLGVSGDD
jgi:hypothetical protein